MNAPSPDALFADYLRSGEPARFAELHDLLRDELLRAAERLAPSRGAAEDLVQATFLGALESAGRFERGRKVVPWLVGILQNQARMMRWRAARSPDPQRVTSPAPRDPAEIAADRELARTLADAFARLGPVYAPVMELHLCSELSAQDIGARLDRPAGTVRTQVVRGTAMLRSLLPAGIASLLLVRLSPGLDAAGVRDVLLDHAARGKVAATSWLGAKALLLAAAGLVAAVLVWFAVASGAGGGASVTTPAAARTDANTGGSSPIAPVVAAATPEANAPPERTAAVAPATAGLTVHVAFVDEPLQNVPVLLMGFADPRFRRAVGVTDPAGNVSFPELAPGQWAVLLQGARTPRSAALVDLQPGDKKEHRVEIGDPLTLGGRVVDELGAPLAGADVWLCDGDYRHSSGFGARRVLAADANGSFTLTVGGRQKLSHVQVTAPGRRASELYALPQQRGEQHTFVLAPDGAGIDGIVVDERGAPIADVFVRAVHAGERGNVVYATSDGTNVTPADTIGAVREITTGADGRFRIGGFDRGRPVAVTAWGADWAKSHGTVVPDDMPATVTMQRGATIQGRVVDQKGKPVAEATVATERDARDDPMRSRVRTDADGRYTLAGVTPGDAVAVTIASRPDPRGGAGVATTTLRLEAGRTLEWNATLAPGPAFRGTLSFSDGSPIADWSFQLVAIDQVDGVDHFPVKLDERGAFEVKNLPHARYWLQLHHGNYVVQRYVVSWPLAERYYIVVPAHVVRRSLRTLSPERAGEQHASGALEVHAVDPFANNLGSRLFALDETGSRRFERLDWDDARSCWRASLRPGRYELGVYSTQRSRDALATADQTVDVTIAAGQTTTLSPVLQPGVRRGFRIDEPSPHLGSVGGTVEVRDADGRLVTSCHLIQTYHHDRPEPGRLEASVALAPGRYCISVETDLGHRGSLDFSVDGLTPFPDVMPLPVR